MAWIAGCLALVVLVAPAEGPSDSRPQPSTAVPSDSPRWDLQGNARPVEHLGRPCLLLDGGAAILKDFKLRDGIVDVDVASSGSRGFLGIQFRVTDDGSDAEFVYLRPHRSGYPDAMQYTPVLKTGLNWQLFNGPGFTSPVEIPKDQWFHLRLEVAGAQAKLFVGNMDVPALAMTDLVSGVQKGQVALVVLMGATWFSNFEIRSTPDAPWERHPPLTPPGTIARWSLSPALDALERNPERPPSAAEAAGMHWDDVEAEPPGVVVIDRYRESPHPQVSFANDFSKRLDPQPGAKLVYARTHVQSDRDQVKKLCVGYSDEVSVFLNGKILFRGRSAQNFRDPAFLGIVSADDDAVYLPLRKGDNELLLAVTELGGGWGFVCRLSDVEE